MEKEKDENPEKNEQKISDQMLSKASETYKWWNNLATLNKEDPIPITLAKIAFRVVGIVVLIALSPIAIIVLFIAFLTVL